MTAILPRTEVGEMSPYPTVDAVTIKNLPRVTPWRNFDKRNDLPDTVEEIPAVIACQKISWKN